MNMRAFYFVLPVLLLAGVRSFPQCGGTDLALNHTATASGSSFVFPASNAFDGDTTSTEWLQVASTASIYVDLGSSMPLCQVSLFWDGTGYAKSYTIDISSDASTWTTVFSTTTNNTTVNAIPIGATARYVRMSGLALHAGGFYYGLYEMKVFGTSGCSAVNMAYHDAATSSSTLNAGFPASAAFDANPSTAWWSGNNGSKNDPQSLTVNLASVQSICNVGLTFSTADYATSYNIDLSTNGTTFTTAKSVTGNTNSVNVVSVAGSAQYVRFSGLTSATSNGYNIMEMTVSGPASTLPIKLVDFTATNENNKQVLLQWTTETEINNKQFNIQRSTDGINYTTIGEVAGAGNSVTALQYEWTDFSPQNGRNLYRLQQVDLDGVLSYSPVDVVSIGGTLGNSLSIFPNPARDVVNVLNPAGELIRQIDVYTIGGVEMSRLAPSTTGSVQLSVSNWPGGVYLIKIITDRGTEVLKLLK